MNIYIYIYIYIYWCVHDVILFYDVKIEFDINKPRILRVLMCALFDRVAGKWCLANVLPLTHITNPACS